jgi:hypothetical protein
MSRTFHSIPRDRLVCRGDTEKTIMGQRKGLVDRDLCGDHCGCFECPERRVNARRPAFEVVEKRRERATPA